MKFSNQIQKLSELEIQELYKTKEFDSQKLSELEIQEFDTQKLSELEKEFHGDILKILKVTS